MRLAAEHGIRVPRVVDVRTDGLVLERIDGVTMAQALASHATGDLQQAATLADLHERLHHVPLDGSSLLHLDLHPQNVILEAAGPVLIDWTNARAGPPELDLAMTWLILITSGGAPGRALAEHFLRLVGVERIRAGLPDAKAFRIADRNVTDVERRLVRAVQPG